MASNTTCTAMVGAILAALLAASGMCQEGGSPVDNVKRLCREYVEGFGSADTRLVYHHRLNGPKGVAALESPEEIAKGRVRGKEMPYGYGSGIQDVALENGHFLFALCDAYEATGEGTYLDSVMRFLQFAARSQSDDGGWREHHSDIPVVLNVAHEAAAYGPLPFDADAMTERALDYLAGQFIPDDAPDETRGVIYETRAHDDVHTRANGYLVLYLLKHLGLYDAGLSVKPLT